MSTKSIVKTLKKENQDFEWYPTTNEILQKIVDSISDKNIYFNNRDDKINILDVGAGDGRALKFLSEKLKFSTNLFGIEKSNILSSKWDSDINYLGSNFHQTNLMDKDISILFCNPPYSEYEDWVSKIIQTSNAKIMYFVVPSRWKNSTTIKQAFASRGINDVIFNLEEDVNQNYNRDYKVSVIGSFDFYNAEREARANVDIIEVFVNVSISSNNKFHKETFYSLNKKSIFEEMFVNHFKKQTEKLEKEKQSDCNKKVINFFNQKHEKLIEDKNSSKDSFNIIDLVNEYEKRNNEVSLAYQKIMEIDSNLLMFLNIDVKEIVSKLQNHFANLKEEYWKAIFNHYQPIYSRLITQYRNELVRKICSSENSLDFNLTNIYDVTLRVIELSSRTFDEQLINYYYELANIDSIKRYKSNQKVFQKYFYRYGKNAEDANTHFMLDYRIISHIYNYFDNINHKNLSHNVKSKLEDLSIIAKHFGFNNIEKEIIEDNNWEYGKRRKIHCIYKGEKVVLLELKLYKNGNMHMFLNSKFLLMLNVYIGKLLGWLKTSNEAYSEMEDEIVSKKMNMSDVEEAFIHDSKNETINMLTNSGAKLLLQNNQ